ncbi:probable E3 ubiquitin-protein ligase ZFP1 isoform X1 [Typha latifolia]|uniref:probable E3 ubiquitin-protein ligase ZFP1 isoform X1 n=1 Tax=Typha latifolia TaxID=4733 RepID=UPI003C2E89DE
MAHRNMIHGHQIIDLESDQGSNQLHPECHSFRGSICNFPNQSVQHAATASVNDADVEQCYYPDCHTRSRSHWNHYNYVQNCHQITTLDLGPALQANFHNPLLSPSSSSRFFPVPWTSACVNLMPMPIDHQALAFSLDGDGGNDNFGESDRGSNKQKNAEVVPGNSNSADRFVTSSSSFSHLSQNFGLRQWGSSHESAVFRDPTTFDLPEHQGSETLPNVEGSSRNARNRSRTVSFQPESAHHTNSFFLASSRGQAFQPTTNAWMAQTGNYTNGGSQWTYCETNLQGGCPSSVAIEMENPDLQGYQNSTSNLNHGSFSYLQHSQMLAHYQHPFCNLFHGSLNPSSSDLHLGSRLPLFLPGVDHIYRPPRHPIQHASFVELPRLDEVENDFDEHRDMRLDVDSMTYEELLALEEQIGDVNTGLSEEFIFEELNTSLYLPRATSSLLGQLSKSAPENETCIICQEEYKEKESLGTLNCGHEYHAPCIMQWLMVKNSCPICKTLAFCTERRSVRRG